MSQEKIVSGNYHDRGGRGSGKPWFIRSSSEEPAAAVAVAAIVARGVAFEASSAHESGFGCGIVARCKSAVLKTVDFSHMKPLAFRGSYFADDMGREVQKCSTLVLLPNGKMYFLPAAEEKSANVSERDRRGKREFV